MITLARRLLPLAALAALAACADLPVGVGLPQAYGARGTVIPSSLAMSTATAPAFSVDAQISAGLVTLAQTQGAFQRTLSSGDVAGSTPIGDVINLGSPIGYEMRNRYLNIGVPLADAFATSADPVFRQQLVQIARWDANSESRANALLALARWHEYNDMQIFNEALVHIDPGVRFAAMEALVVWGHKREAEALLGAAADRDPEPVLRVYAAACLARLGDPSGFARLRQGLDDGSWVIKSMSAKYIGDFGTAEDYTILLNRIDGEVGNDFVVAEFCVSALKLYPKFKAAQKVAVQPTKRLGDDGPLNGDLLVDSEDAYALEPLLVTAPRLQAQVDPIDPRIDQQLLRMLQSHMNERPNQGAQLDASIGTLAKLTTLTGYNLQTRYTQLSFLLTEGLAGTTDYQLQTALETVARQAKNVQSRAAAMIALAYAKDTRYLLLFQGALSATESVTVRFAGLESLMVLGEQSSQLQIANAARADASIPIQIYAAAEMWRSGDVLGRELLIRLYKSPDWLTRAMAYHYFGELGAGDEYVRLQREIDGEQDPEVKAELLSALVKLTPRKDQ
jgi:HEAT repeat protein